jgi:hypothetical protein
VLCLQVRKLNQIVHIRTVCHEEVSATMLSSPGDGLH